MLLNLFRWLDSHPGFYPVIALAATLLLVGWIVRGLRTSDRSARRAEGWIFAGLLLGFVLAWRWPFLLYASEYNPDESQFIASGLTLAYDPVFWRSVDGITSGPLNFYVLVPLRWLGLPFDYFTVRLVGLLLTWAALLGLYRFFRTQAAPATAQLAVLSIAVFHALAMDADLVHYSSELVALALLAAALATAEPGPRCSAFLAGCLPWAKLQAGPLGAVLGAWLLWQAWGQARRHSTSPWRAVATLVGWALVPSLFALTSLACFGQLEHFYRRYVLQNAIYVGEGGAHGAVLRELARRSAETGHFNLWAGGGLLFLTVAGIVHAVRRQRLSKFFWLGAALTAAATICILLPARTSLHYVLFLTVPLGFWTGITWCELGAQPGRLRPVLALLAFGCALLPFVARLPRTHGMFGQFADQWTRPYTQLGAVLRHWHAPGRQLAMWGWLNSAYVEGGFRHATRDAISEWCINDLPQRDYYRATYLADLQRNRPELFVDSVGPHDTVFTDRTTQAHEIFPALAEYIGQHYILVTDLPAGRIYARNDFLAAHPLPDAQLPRLLAKGRPEYEPAGDPASAVPPAPVYARLGSQSVRLLEPPAELVWPLDGTERIAQVDFGYLPEAHNDHPTDGAEFIMELRPPGKPPLQVYHRMLDPRGQELDCGPQNAVVTLPPFPAGSTLAVRTTAGKVGDARWDQVYLSRIRFNHLPRPLPQQFPGFQRVPDFVAASYPYLVQQDESWRLMLPPPTALTFVLEGTERQFNFSYGLAEGAYTKGGSSDGANYRVEILHPGAAPRVIYERYLDPVRQENDRGPQSADLTLPPGLQRGDRIVLHLEAGTGDSWDWTYVSALDLR